MLLKGHLFLLSFFVRDKCLFSLFLILILYDVPTFFFRRSLFFPPLTFFLPLTFFTALHNFLRRSLVSTPHFSVYVLSFSVPKYFGRESKRSNVAKHRQHGKTVKAIKFILTLLRSYGFYPLASISS